MNGLLLIDKPQGWTSFDVVAKIRSLLRQSGVAQPKVGHCGTLDPLATGLLLVVVGDYTKRAQEFTKLDKTYHVTLKLGQTSSTGDEEGEKTKISAKKPSQSAVEAVLRGFMGQSQQVPPQFSAVKVNGQRAYKLARQGKTVNIEPRTVTIYDITGVEYHYPLVRCVTKVSSGTYIRSLVEDIGTKLGTGAYMSDLRRTEVGSWAVDSATPIKEITAAVLTQSLR